MPAPRSISLSVLSVLLVLGAAVPAAPAQDGSPAPSAVEMPSFDGSALRPATRTYEMRVSRGGQTSKRTTTVTLSKSSRDGRPTWKVVRETGRQGRTSTGTLHVDRSTLLPVSFRTDGGTIDLTYDDRTVTGTFGRGGRSRSVDTTLAVPVLDGESLHRNVALASLSLEVGQSFWLRSFSPLGPSVTLAECSVTGTESVDVPAGTVETYVVQMESSGDGTQTTATLYLRRRAPHVLVRGEATITTGGGMSLQMTRVLTESE